MTKNVVKDNHQFQELDKELTRTIPNFKKIEDAIEKVPPAVLAIAIQEDVGFTYLIDYYFRHIDSSIVKKILQNPMFTHEALIELFYCQITAYHKAILQKKPTPELISSYWTNLSKAEYAIIFKNLMKRTSSFETAKIVFSKLDFVYLKLMTSSGSITSEKLLNFFKKLGPEIEKLAVQDMNFYDFAFELATHESDEEYLSFLEEYTVVFVQLRLVSSFLEEMERMIRLNGGAIPSQVQILTLFGQVPRDSIDITLKVFQEKHWITESEAKSIEEYCKNLH